MTTHGSMTAPRLFIGVFLPLLILALALGPFLVFSARLPEPIATTWGTDGRANASAPLWFFVAVTALMTGIPAVVLARLAWRREPRRQEVALPAAIATLFGGGVAVVSASIASNNLDQPSWTTAPRLDPGLSLAPLLIPARRRPSDSWRASGSSGSGPFGLGGWRGRPRGSCSPARR